MSSKLPIWARAVLRLDRYAWYAYHAHELVRDEVLYAWLSPSARPAMTVEAYSALSSYLPGGATFEGGLFAWERALLALPTIPRGGRVLVAAAGGGREVQALCQAGYEVVAFEPNGTLFAGLSEVVGHQRGAIAVRASYDDLVLAAENHTGPLYEATRAGFDWVLFGWGSFTHLTDTRMQSRVVGAVRALAPNAPLVLSFFMLRSSNLVGGRSERMRTLLRRALRPLRSFPEPPIGVAYESGGGFVYRFTELEIETLAATHAYELARFDAESFPHAVFAPKRARTLNGDHVELPNERPAVGPGP